MRSDVSSAHHSQQQGRELYAQRGGHGQDEREQAGNPEKITVYQTEFHVLEVEPGDVAGQRLSDHEVRHQAPADAATALDNE